MSELLKLQRNDVFECIEQAGLSPAQFNWIQIGHPHFGPCSVLECRGTRWSFAFGSDERDPSRHRSEFSPGTERTTEYQLVANWHMQLGVVSHWLECLKREFDAPDLWEEFGNYAIEFEPGDGVQDWPNEAFTATQVDRVATLLDKTRARLLEYVGESKVERRIVGERMDYLSRAARTQGRRDWAFMLIGVLVTLFVSLDIDSAAAHEIWIGARDAVLALVDVLPELPQ